MKKFTMSTSVVLVIALLAASVFAGVTITDTSTGRSVTANSIWDALKAFFGGGATGAAVGGAHMGLMYTGMTQAVSGVSFGVEVDESGASPPGWIFIWGGSLAPASIIGASNAGGPCTVKGNQGPSTVINCLTNAHPITITTDVPVTTSVRTYPVLRKDIGLGVGRWTGSDPTTVTVKPLGNAGPHPGGPQADINPPAPNDGGQGGGRGGHGGGCVLTRSQAGGSTDTAVEFSETSDTAAGFTSIAGDTNGIILSPLDYSDNTFNVDVTATSPTLSNKLEGTCEFDGLALDSQAPNSVLETTVWWCEDFSSPFNTAENGDMLEPGQNGCYVSEFDSTNAVTAVSVNNIVVDHTMANFKAFGGQGKFQTNFEGDLATAPTGVTSVEVAVSGTGFAFVKNLPATQFGDDISTNDGFSFCSWSAGKFGCSIDVPNVLSGANQDPGVYEVTVTTNNGAAVVSEFDVFLDEVGPHLKN